MSAPGHDAVRNICENWATMTLEEFREVMAEDCDYRNMPIEGDRHIGPDAAHAVLSTIGAKWDIDLKVVNLVGDDRVVMTGADRALRPQGRQPRALRAAGDGRVRTARWQGHRVAGLLRAEPPSAPLTVGWQGACRDGAERSEASEAAVGDAKRSKALQP